MNTPNHKRKINNSSRGSQSQLGFDRDLHLCLCTTCSKNVMPETTKNQLALSKLPTVFLCGFIHLATMTFTLLQGCPEAFSSLLVSRCLEAASKHQVLQPPENLAKTASGEEIKGKAAAVVKHWNSTPSPKMRVP